MPSDRYFGIRMIRPKAVPNRFSSTRIGIEDHRLQGDYGEEIPR